MTDVNSYTIQKDGMQITVDLEGVTVLDPTSCSSFAKGLDPALGKIQCSEEPEHNGAHYSGVVNVLGEDRVFEWFDVIRIAGDIRKDEGLYAECDCSWSFGPLKSMPKLGNAALQHAKETGHQLRRHR